MLISPSAVKTTLAAPLATSVALLTAIPTSVRLAQGRRIIHAVARRAGHVFSGLQMLHHNVVVFRIHFGESVSSSHEIDRLVPGLGAGCLKIGHAQDVRQSDSLRDLTRYWQGITSQHFHSDAEAPEFGDELLGVGPGRVVKRHKTDECWNTNLGSQGDCECSVTFHH
jgi:hypothetical protein